MCQKQLFTGEFFCNLRSNIFEALGRCKAMGAEGNAATSQAWKDHFIAALLLPQANALEDDGWCAHEVHATFVQVNLLLLLLL